MSYQLIEEADANTYIIDGLSLRLPKYNASFIFDEELLIITNVGPSPSVKHLIKALEKLNNRLSRVKYILVTRIDLTSIGGIGLLKQACPNARILTPLEFKDQLVNLKPLISTTRAMYGDYFTEHFEPVIQIKETDLEILDVSQTLKLSETRELSFKLTENHHLLIQDSKTNSLFTSLAAGVYYNQLQDDGIELYLPIISVDDFSESAFLHTLKFIKEANVKTLYFDRYGKTNKVNEALNQLYDWFMQFKEITLATDGHYNEVSQAMLGVVHLYLSQQGIPDNHPVYQYLLLDLNTLALAMTNAYKKR